MRVIFLNLLLIFSSTVFADTSNHICQKKMLPCMVSIMKVRAKIVFTAHKNVSELVIF